MAAPLAAPEPASLSIALRTASRSTSFVVLPSSSRGGIEGGEGSSGFAVFGGFGSDGDLVVDVAGGRPFNDVRRLLLSHVYRVGRLSDSGTKKAAAGYHGSGIVELGSCRCDVDACSGG